VETPSSTDSMSSSSTHRHHTITPHNPSSTPSIPPSTPNGVAENLHIPRYHFPPNLVPPVRRQPSIKSPQPRYPDYCPSPSASSTPISRQDSINHHVTETHHITKDYDSRTGAKTINRYEFLETIGKGVHGKVKLAKDIESGEFVAIKIVNRVTKKRLGRWDPMEAEQKIRREIAIMKKCIHPHVVALREVMDDPNSKKIYLGMMNCNRP